MARNMDSREKLSTQRLSAAAMVKICIIGLLKNCFADGTVGFTSFIKFPIPSICYKCVHVWCIYKLNLFRVNIITENMEYARKKALKMSEIGLPAIWGCG